MQVKKQNLKSVIWAPEFGRPKRYTDLPNDLDTSMNETKKHKRENNDKRMTDK